MANPADNKSENPPRKLPTPSPAEIEDALAQAKSCLPPECYLLLEKVARTYLKAIGLIKIGKISTRTLRRMLRIPWLTRTPDSEASQDPQKS